METVQFYLSRVAAEAVDVDQVKFRARERGVLNASAETSYYKSGGRCRVTCRLAVAEVLESELRTMIHATTKQTVRDECLRALDAIAEAKRIAGRTPRSGDTFYAG